MNPWLLLPATMIMFREVVVSGLREYLGHAAKGLRVTTLAKWKTTAQMVAIAVLFASGVGTTENPLGLDLKPGGIDLLFKGGTVLLWIAAALTLVTGVGLFRPGDAVSQGRGMIEIRYFAWVRERVGTPRESLETAAATVAELVGELRARDAAHAYAFEDIRALRVALDQELAEFSAPLAGRARGGVLSADDGGVMAAAVSPVRVQSAALRSGRRGQCFAADLVGTRAGAGAVVTFSRSRPRRRRAAFGDGDRALSGHDRARDRGDPRPGGGALGAGGRAGDPPPRPARARRDDHDGGHRGAASRRSLRRRRVPDGLSEKPRAVLEEGIRPRRRRMGRRRGARTRRRWTAGSGFRAPGPRW